MKIICEKFKYLQHTNNQHHTYINHKAVNFLNFQWVVKRITCRKW